MLFSDLTPLDLFELSGDEPVAERIYDSLVSAVNDQFDLTVGESRLEAILYGAALTFARAGYTQKSAALQGLLSNVDELLPVLENGYGIRPPFDATFADRKAELARRMRRPSVWTKVAIETALAELLGDDFIAYRPTPLADVVRWPVDIEEPQINLQPPTVERKIVRLLDAVSFTGVELEIRYELVTSPRAPSAPGAADLVVGDKVVVDGSILGLTETVEVIAVDSVTTDGDPKSFRASFRFAHDAGTLGFTHPYPAWQTTKRHSLVILTAAAAADPETRARVHAQMQRMARGCSTWDIVASDDAVETNQFLVGRPGLGLETIGQITI